LEKVGDDQKKIIEDEMKLIQIGLQGEKNVAYELKNSFLPIVCLHDLRLEYKDYSAQFDFIVISKKCIFVLETKKLTGDIMIDSAGNFIRAYKDYKGNVYKKEGINSPVSQNEKHVDVLKRFLKENKMDKNIPISSLIVIANPKTIITYKYAKKEIRDIIIKHDQIKSKINEILNSLENYSGSLNDKTMMELANFLLSNDRHIEYDYIKKFNLKIEVPVIEVPVEVEIMPAVESGLEKAEDGKLDDSLFESLKSYRYTKSKEKNIPLWFIFNNEQLSNLVLNRPKNKEEFISISGFGEKKYDEFGEDIISLILGVDPINNNQTVSQEQESNQEKENVQPILNNKDAKVDQSNEALYKELREFRLNLSKAENIKPYFIFNNEELDLLCSSKPKDKSEFILVKGFGEKKYEKYGETIINIINKYL
jgi:hypothetical protein